MKHDTNWAGNIAYSAPRIRRPKRIEDLQRIVRESDHIRVVGSRHSFNAIADSAALVSLEALPRRVHVDSGARTVTVPAGLTYGALTRQLDAHGLALHNLASLPHITVGGAISTATHGSGDGNGNLATAVAGLDMVLSNGEIVQIKRGDPNFEGMVIGLGALGAVISVTLDGQPSYEVQQVVYENLSWEALAEHFDAITASGDSVSLFTTFEDTVDQVWVKQRSESAHAESSFFGAHAATVDKHPLATMDPRNCTPQMSIPGVWWQRLPHFRMEFQPSAGAELQSEYFVRREHAAPALQVIREHMAERLRPILQVSEIRTVTADRLWLSPQYERDCVCFHFTWQPRQMEVEALLVELESALRQFEARPHWGKLFAARAMDIAPLYPRLPDFLRLVDQLDPRGAFSNAWFLERVRGAPMTTEPPLASAT